MKVYSRGIAAIVVSLAETTSAADRLAWPDLPTTGFVQGRIATVDDVKNGDAVFSMDGKSQGVLAVRVPQYVFWSDERGKRHPMILVQAERGPDGSEIVGLRDLKGGETAATLAELTLLGNRKPR